MAEKKQKSGSVDTWTCVKKSGSSHYKSRGVEPLDLYKSGGMLRDYVITSIIKYAFRNRREVCARISISDMEKIKHEADILIAEATSSNGKTKKTGAGAKSAGAKLAAKPKSKATKKAKGSKQADGDLQSGAFGAGEATTQTVSAWDYSKG